MAEADLECLVLQPLPPKCWIIDMYLHTWASLVIWPLAVSGLSSDTPRVSNVLVAVSDPLVDP